MESIMFQSHQIPPTYVCSITNQIMLEPVTAADGHTYEREAIEQWLETYDTSPITKNILEHKRLMPNQDMQAAILEFLDVNQEFYEGNKLYLSKKSMLQCTLAIKNNQLSDVQQLLNKDRRLLIAKLEGDATALKLACEFSSPELVDMLLERLEQKNQLSMPNALGFKLTHLNVLLERALENGNQRKCELLLRLGAKVKYPADLIPDTVQQEDLGICVKIKSLEEQLQSITPQISPSGTSVPLAFLQQNASSSVPLNALDLKQVLEFLKLVAEGKQNQAEKMLKSDPKLALVSGNVTDLSKRTFENITGFQYAVWALDWHMWTMIRKYLSDEEARFQARGFETGSWVTQHGIHAKMLLDNLIQAYQITINLHEQRQYAKGDQAWVKEVGGAQLLLPAHVINEYCHPARSYEPVPNFRDISMLPRCRATDRGDWFSTHNGSKLGQTYAVYRGENEVSVAQFVDIYDSTDMLLHVAKLGRPDQASLIALVHTRTAQREELLTELRYRSMPEKLPHNQQVLSGKT